MSSRISGVILALPGALPRERQRPYNRNPARCQPTTISGFTISSASAQRDQTLRNAVQNSLSIRLSLGRRRYLRFQPVQMLSFLREHGFFGREKDRKASQNKQGYYPKSQAPSSSLLNSK